MKLIKYFSKLEIALWSVSVFLILTSFLLFDRENYLTLTASVTGVTSLIFCAKGNPVGQILMIVFSLLYGIISYTFDYYGEMMTYLGMAAPMAAFSLISWIKNPYNGNRSEVKVNRLKFKEITFIFALSIFVTIIFYFILKAFNTANIIPSTISVATSFFAMCLLYKRSEWFTLAYAANDIVLIILWIMASFSDKSYYSVAVCFIVFLINDIYGFISWSKMKKKQDI